MEKKYYKVSAKAGSDTAEIFIYGVIGDCWFEESVTARQFVSDIKSLEESHRRINVHINSPGGSVFDGLPIFNALQNSKSEVHTYNDGLAASMGAVILLAGSAVHASKNSLMMLHSPSTWAAGNARDMQEAINMLDKVQHSLVESVRQKVNLPKEQVEKMWFDYQDHWLTADEAIAEGLIDELTEEKAKIPEKTDTKDYRQLMAQWPEMMPREKKQNKFAAWFESLLNKSSETLPEDPITTDDSTKINSSSEMDNTLLRTALGMSDTATDNEILAGIIDTRNELAALKAENATVKADLQKAQADLQAAKAEIEELGKAPGATSAAIDPPVSSSKEEDFKPASNLHEAMANLRKMDKK